MSSSKRKKDVVPWSPCRLLLRGRDGLGSGQRRPWESCFLRTRHNSSGIGRKTRDIDWGPPGLLSLLRFFALVPTVVDAADGADHSKRGRPVPANYLRPPISRQLCSPIAADSSVESGYDSGVVVAATIAGQPHSISRVHFWQGLQRALTSLESTRQALLGLANLSQQQTCPDACDPNKWVDRVRPSLNEEWQLTHVLPHLCSRWKKCTCVSPATYDSEGRGNCNFGATKLDTKGEFYSDDKKWTVL